MLKGAGKSQTLILSPGQTGVVVRADGTKQLLQQLKHRGLKLVRMKHSWLNQMLMALAMMSA